MIADQVHLSLRNACFLLRRQDRRTLRRRQTGRRMDQIIIVVPPLVHERSKSFSPVKVVLADMVKRTVNLTDHPIGLFGKGSGTKAFFPFAFGTSERRIRMLTVYRLPFTVESDHVFVNGKASTKIARKATQLSKH